ncbi:MAG: SDR family oxidoreductase [Geminicoccaceae bacterium]
MAQRLEGKTVLVTAAAQGIGRATALAMAKEGATVLASDINMGLLLELEAESNISTLVLDVTNADAIAQLAVDDRCFDGIVNVAGIVHHGNILEADDDAMTASFDINVRSMHRIVRACLPAMVAAGGGSIVNIASVASSLMGVPNRFIYGTTKAAVIGLTKSVAADFVGEGIRCNAICPGTVQSPSLDERINAFDDPEEARKQFVARQPMGRIGTAEEIAAAAVYLIADESAYTTGTTLVIDGGMTI